MLHTEDSSLDRRRTQSWPRRKPEASASASAPAQRARTPYPGPERGQLAHGWQLERPRPPPTATRPRPARRRKWRMFWRLRAGRGVNGSDAFSFYFLRFQARFLSSGPHKSSGLSAAQAERAPWGFRRLCSPGWLSTISAGAGGFLGSGAAWVTVRPRTTRPRVSFRPPWQCRELSGAAKRRSRADEAPESWSCQVSVCPGKAAFPRVCAALPAAVYLTHYSGVAPYILVL